MIWDQITRELALAEAERWRGVPHVDRASNFPTGIDCIHYVAEIMFACGVVERRDLPSYDTMVGIAKESDSMELAFFKAVHVESLDPKIHPPQFGDVVLFKTGFTSAHCAFFAGKHLYHSLANRCVTRSEWPHWKAKAESLIRFYEKGWR